MPARRGRIACAAVCTAAALSTHARTHSTRDRTRARPRTSGQHSHTRDCDCDTDIATPAVASRAVLCRQQEHLHPLTNSTGEAVEADDEGKPRPDPSQCCYDALHEVGFDLCQPDLRQLTSPGPQLYDTVDFIADELESPGVRGKLEEIATSKEAPTWIDSDKTFFELQVNEKGR